MTLFFLNKKKYSLAKIVNSGFSVYKFVEISQIWTKMNFHTKKREKKKEGNHPKPFYYFSLFRPVLIITENK